MVLFTLSGGKHQRNNRRRKRKRSVWMDLKMLNAVRTRYITLLVCVGCLSLLSSRAGDMGSAVCIDPTGVDCNKVTNSGSVSVCMWCKWTKLQCIPLRSRETKNVRAKAKFELTKLFPREKYKWDIWNVSHNPKIQVFRVRANRDVLYLALFISLPWHTLQGKLFTKPLICWIF